jgi:hypothetical protein
MYNLDEAQRLYSELRGFYFSKSGILFPDLVVRERKTTEEEFQLSSITRRVTNGHYVRGTKEIFTRLGKQTQQVAAILIHEATHAWLDQRGTHPKLEEGICELVSAHVLYILIKDKRVVLLGLNSNHPQYISERDTCLADFELRMGKSVFDSSGLEVYQYLTNSMDKL